MPLEGIFGGIGDIVGGFAGNADREEAMRYLNNARLGYEQLRPDIAAQTVGRSELMGADPSTRAAQLDALTQLRDQYRSGGLDAMTRAQLAEIQGQNTQMAQGAQQAVLQDASRRGQLRSNASLSAAQLAGQQQAQRSATQSVQAQGIGQQNRMNAIHGAAGLAGNIRGQDYERAAAQDAVARFNASQRQGAQQASFGNSLARQQGVAGAAGAQADHKNADAQRTQRMWGGLGRAVGGVGDAVFTGGTSLFGAGAKDGGVNLQG